MRYLVLLLVVVLLGCSQPNQKFTGYADILHAEYSILDKFGVYELSPDGTDSLWKKTYYGVKYDYAMELMERKKPLDSAWKELMWKSKKYDTFPQPTDYEIESRLRHNKTFESVLKSISLN